MFDLQSHSPVVCSVVLSHGLTEAVLNSVQGLKSSTLAFPLSSDNKGEKIVRFIKI